MIRSERRRNLYCRARAGFSDNRIARRLGSSETPDPSRKSARFLCHRASASSHISNRSRRQSRQPDNLSSESQKGVPANKLATKNWQWGCRGGRVGRKICVTELERQPCLPRRSHFCEGSATRFVIREFFLLNSSFLLSHRLWLGSRH